jgi:hypothetical protein
MYCGYRAVVTVMPTFLLDGGHELLGSALDKLTFVALEHQ